MTTMLLLLGFASVLFPLKSGKMSWYGEPFHGRLTACGEVFDMNSISVAHKSLPIGTEVVFFYGDRSVVAVVNDRGPYYEDREWDASKALAKELFGEDFDKGVLEVAYVLTGRRVLRDTMRYNL